MSFVLGSTTDKIQVITTGASATFDFTTQRGIASAPGSGAAMIPVDASPLVGTIAAGGATTDISGSPAAGERWNVWSDVRNTHASASGTVEVQQIKAGGTARSAIKVTLPAQYTLTRTANGEWKVIDPNGVTMSSSLQASDTVAGAIMISSRADLEAATEVSRSVSSGRLQYHPGVAKFWLKATGGSTTVLASYNVTSIANTATGRMTVTIGTDFSSANWACQVTTEPASNSTAVANRRLPCVANAGQAAGTVEVNAWDAAATNNALANPTSWHVTGYGTQV